MCVVGWESGVFGGLHLRTICGTFWRLPVPSSRGLRRQTHLQATRLTLRTIYFRMFDLKTFQFQGLDFFSNSFSFVQPGMKFGRADSDQRDTAQQWLIQLEVWARTKAPVDASTGQKHASCPSQYALPDGSAAPIAKTRAYRPTAPKNATGTVRAPSRPLTQSAYRSSSE